ncbi:DUF4376 domain-containing protein [Paraburkholderia phytofirmans]|jgi:hypothetical protein|uniref:DUF4376 domain-containing protein n=1 Tax=Paraburkholderia phytofirmans TaxID=261302 RepID=UPI0038BC2C4B
MGQKFAAYNSAGAITAFYDSEDSPIPEGIADAIKITDAEWQACISTPGYAVLNGVLVVPPPATEPELLASAQAAQMSALTAAYQAAVQQSVSFTTAAGAAKMFQADNNSQNVLLIATTGYNLAGETPPGFYWVAGDNTQVPFTLADLKGLYAVMLQQGNTAFQTLQTLKAQVRSATTIGAVQSIKWS